MATDLICTSDPDRAPRFRGLSHGRSGPVRIRIGMLRDDSCFGCNGTGYMRHGAECLHHHPDCEPGSCAEGCEVRAMTEGEL